MSPILGVWILHNARTSLLHLREIHNNNKKKKKNIITKQPSTIICHSYKFDIDPLGCFERHSMPFTSLSGNAQEDIR